MSEIQWLAEAEKLSAELTQLRHQIHEDPELGNQEFHTAQLVERYLQDCGIETCRLTDTAVMGVLRGAAHGGVVGLRADMDALPVTEATGAAFASRTRGKMHACGHDIHTTALLGAAKLLSIHKDRLCGTVKFFFQPNEEGGGGADRMIEAGCMQEPRVQAVFGAHVDPGIPQGTVGLCDGKFYAAADNFQITVKGKGSHGAKPEKGINALKAAAELTLLLQALPENFEDKTIVTVGTFHAGTAGNIIADEAQLQGTIRTLGSDDRRRMQELFYNAVQTIEQKTGVQIEVQMQQSHPGIVNTKQMTDFVRRTLLEASIPTEDITIPTMVSEDFGFFVEAAMGSFYHIGVGGEAELHNGCFLPNDSVLPLAAAVHATVAAAYLEKDNRKERTI